MITTRVTRSAPAGRAAPAVPDATPASSPRPPQVGAVSYLNSKPLIQGLAERLNGGLKLDFPSRLASSLRAGDLDVALIPSVEVLRAEGDYEIVSDACVAARGPVRSVKVYFRVPPGDVRTLALDEGSRTSATLARILLRHKYGVEPVCEPLPLPTGERGASAPWSTSPLTSRTPADAILLIGDRAMFPLDEPFVAVWDLGEEWLHWTGLPFVFAVWAARAESVPAGLAELLSATRDSGVAEAEAIARREAALLGLDPDVAVEYLTRNLHFTLGPAERSGLKLFSRLASQAGLAPEGIDLVFRDPADRSAPRTPAPAAIPPGPKRRGLVGAR